MTYKDKLIKFLQLKNDTIYKQVRIKYVYKADLKDISLWSEDDCEKIYNVIKDNIVFYKVQGIDETTCPWCIKYTIKYTICKNCEYGKRHEKCYNIGSYYKKHFCMIVINNQEYKDIIKEIEDE